MSHGTAFLLVGRDLMWGFVWLLPLIFFAWSIDNPKDDFTKEAAVVSYAAVCALCYAAGAGLI